MTIQTLNTGRFSINGLSEANLDGSTQKMGFRGHWSMTGWILSCGCIDKAFKDQQAGWVNKKSVIKYLHRNYVKGLEQDDRNQIAQLNEKSSCSTVQALFDRVKQAVAVAEKKNDPVPPKKKDLGPPKVERPVYKDRQETDPKFVGQFVLPGRYHRGHNCRVNWETTVRLMDSKVAYPANHVRPKGLFPFIVSEGPSAYDAFDYSKEPFEKYPNDDVHYYYEMVWKENPPLLVSAADMALTKKEAFGFLREKGQTLKFTTTDGKPFEVECTAGLGEPGGIFDKIALKMTFNKETRIYIHFNLNDNFRYREFEAKDDKRSVEERKDDNEGLNAAKYLYDFYIKNRSKENPVIVNCVTGKDRSAALIMWVWIFESIHQEKLKPEEVTFKYLEEFAKAFELQSAEGVLTDHVRSTIKLYYTEEELIEAIKLVCSPVVPSKS